MSDPAPIISLMIKMEVRHCDIRGDEISPVQYLDFETKETAAEYINKLPHKRGKEYFYAKVQINGKTEVVDPTRNHRYNLQQRLLRVIFNENQYR